MASRQRLLLLVLVNECINNIGPRVHTDPTNAVKLNKQTNVPRNPIKIPTEFVFREATYACVLLFDVMATCAADDYRLIIIISESYQ